MHSYDARKFFLAEFGSLNPCCNGRCTRTINGDWQTTIYVTVLILVVMEDALVLPIVCL